MNKRVFEFFCISERSAKYNSLKCLGLGNVISCIHFEDGSFSQLPLFLQWTSLFSLSIRKSLKYTPLGEFLIFNSVENTFKDYWDTERYSSPEWWIVAWTNVYIIWGGVDNNEWSDSEKIKCHGSTGIWFTSTSQRQMSICLSSRIMPPLSLSHLWKNWRARIENVKKCG